MSRPGSGKKRWQTAQLERLEDRLAMSAEPVYDFWASVAAPEVAAPLESPIALASSAHQQTGVAAVQQNYGFSGSGQTVAVIDTGIAWDHYALGAGYGSSYRVVGGWDFAENDANPYDDGPAGFHGTHVAGIIGSNDQTNRGVATDVDLVALRVFNDQGGGTFEWVAQALRWVHEHRFDFDNPITTVNLSLGAKWNANTLPNWATLEGELKQLYDDGIFVSVAAGNDFAKYNAAGLSYPAVSPYVVPVGSVTSTGDFSNFSQRSERILAAPGQAITSTVPDWLYGGNGIPNDFGKVSGTSMAAPYVAGAAVLVREAMEFVGYAGITQDTIYDHLRSTADVFHDTATSANYFRINVGRAIDALLPDDVGDTVTTGAQLGTLTDSLAASGVIGRLDDTDVFTFTAGASGNVALRAELRDRLVGQWDVSGAVANGSGNELSFRVVAGQQYSVKLGTSAGIGHYAINLQLTADATTAPAVTDWGQITDAHFAYPSVAGDAWYQLTAGREGILTLAATANGDHVRVELLSAQRQLLGEASFHGGYARLDANVQGGETYYVRVSGQASDVDLRLLNLVSQTGTAVAIYGTSGNDSFTFTAGVQHSLSINGVEYRFNAGQATSFQFFGQGGEDSAALTGTTRSDVATFNGTTATLAGGGYRATANSITNVTFDGGGGSDRLDLGDTAGDDRVTIARNDVNLIGGGLRVRGLNFSMVNVSASGGQDEVTFYDTAGHDRFIASPTSASMTGAGYSHAARGFENVFAIASAGSDSAYLFDSLGNDVLIATPTETTLSGIGFTNKVSGFNRVYAYATTGQDTATFYDSRGNDRFYGAPTRSWMTGASFYNSATGFNQVTAYAASGQDTASLYESSGQDQYVSGAARVTLRGASFENTAVGFAEVNSFGAQGQSIANFNSAAANVDRDFFQALGQAQSSSEFASPSALTQAHMAELLVGFEFATARTAQQAKLEVAALDALFGEEGQW